MSEQLVTLRGREAWLSEMSEKTLRIRYSDEPTHRARRGTAGSYPPMHSIGKKAARSLEAAGELVYK